MSSSISGISIAPILARPTSSKASAAGASSTTATPTIGKGHKSKNKSATDFFAQIQQAVASALQSAKQSDASDPNETIKSAIEKVFSQNPLPQDTNPEAEASKLTSATGGTADAAHTAFLQALKANGIDPEQFKSDFLAAVKQAKNGAANVASALKSLPTGSLLDVAA